MILRGAMSGWAYEMLHTARKERLTLNFGMVHLPQDDTDRIQQSEAYWMAVGGVLTCTVRTQPGRLRIWHLQG